MFRPLSRVLCQLSYLKRVTTLFPVISENEDDLIVYFYSPESALSERSCSLNTFISINNPAGMIKTPSGHPLVTYIGATSLYLHRKGHQYLNFSKDLIKQIKIKLPLL